MRPNFEDPLDTAKQLVKQNITLYYIPGGDIWKQFLLESPIPEYNILGENFIIPDDWELYYNISEHDVIGAGTHAYMASYLTPYYLAMGENEEINSGRGWHRSKDKVGEYPYAGYLTNKNWHLNDVIIKSKYADTRL